MKKCIIYFSLGWIIGNAIHSVKAQQKIPSVYLWDKRNVVLKADILDKPTLVKVNGYVLIRLNGKEIGIPYVNLSGNKLKWMETK